MKLLSRLSRLSRILILSVLATPVLAHAQVGLYLNPVAIRVSNSTADTGLYAFLGQNSTSQFFYGPEFGAYYDFKSPYAVAAGLDVRDSYVHGNGAALNNFLVGIRVSGKPFQNNFRFYVEPYVGAGTSRAPFTVLHITKAEYGVYGGVDYQTTHHIDLRAIEIGYGSLTTVSSQIIGNTGIVPSASLLSISTGLVFRFP